MRLHWVTVAILLHVGMTGCAGHRAMPQGPVIASGPPTPAAKPPPRERRKVAPSGRAVRPARVDSVRLEVALLRRHSHAPLARVLSRRSGNTLIADRAATAVLSESKRLRLSPSLVAAVLLVENTPMDTTALSVAGAIGLMQVMPVHGGAMGCASPELLEVEANICHGTRVLKMYLRRTRTVRAALQFLFILKKFYFLIIFRIANKF